MSNHNGATVSGAALAGRGEGVGVHSEGQQAAAQRGFEGEEGAPAAYTADAEATRYVLPVVMTR